MLSSLARLLLTSTAIAPVLLTYGWVAYQSAQPLIAYIMWGVCLVLIMLCRFLLRYAQHNLERVKFSAVSIEAADGEIIGFLLLYLLPLFTTDFNTLNWHLWVPALVIFAAVVGTGYTYHFNPLLGLMGWHFYKVHTEEGVAYVLITKRQLRKAADLISVGQLTEYIVIEIE